MTDHVPDTHQSVPATEPLALKSNLVLGPNAQDDECSAPPRVTDPPDDLWLVYGELEHDDTHWNCCREGEVSWCEDKQYDSDVHYVRGERYDDLHTALLALTNAADDVGVAHFDSDDLPPAVRALQDAVTAARVALGA